MNCPACGHGNRAQAKFCEECGAPLVRVCPGCRAEVGPGARFCDACGRVLDTVPAPSPAEGEHRTVTVLFADAVGSTPMAERLGEEQMYSLMQGCLACMTEAVRTYGGHVATFTGDGIMAVFGAPVAHEEPERRAVAAALEMQRALAQYARRVAHPVCHFRVGLNTGPAVVGKVSEDLTLEFTAIGDTVNLAARMQQVAEPGAVYLTERTQRAVADYFECEAVGPLAVKGKDDLVPAWRVLREKFVRSRLERAAERGLAPFVGREAELIELEQHRLRRAEQGRGQVVFLSGEAGMGKSRLLLEFRHRVGDRKRWLQGNCTSFGRAIPYLPMIDLLKRAFSVQEGDADDEIVHRVEEGTAGWDEAARATVPYLRYLLSVDPGDARMATMDPRERRAGILDGLRSLLREESARSPLVVVVVEDLHWIDAASEHALAALVDAVPSMPLLLLLTHRPGHTGAPERSHAARMVLEPLARSESAELIRGVLGVGGLPPELEPLVVGKAEGNPFYTEEVVRSLAETGVLARANGDYVVTRALAEIRVPDTIQEVILSRIDRLERPTKAALQLASVIGREFTLHLLERVSDLEPRLERALSELKTLELIYEKAWFPELVYMFKHALTHDVTYSTLLADRRRTLHCLVGAAIEELYTDRLAEHYETLAHHYLEGRDWPKALEYLDKAGDKAAAAFANQDALDYYARALEVCERLGEIALPTVVALCRRRANVNIGVGRFGDAVEDLNDCLHAAGQLGDPRLKGIALSYRGFAEIYLHDYDAAEATLREGLHLIEKSGEGADQLRGLASVFLCLLLVVRDRHAEAEPVFRLLEGRAGEFQDPFAQGFWAWLASRWELWRGNLDTALRKAEEGRALVGAVMFNRLVAQWSEAHALATAGRYEAALRLLYDTLATCERVGDTVVRVRVLNTLGYVYAEVCDLETAMHWNRQGLEMAQAINAPAPEVEMNARLNLAENLLAAGDLDAASEHFSLAEEVVRHPKPVQDWMRWRYGQRFLHSFGEWWLARGDPAQALAHAEECLAWAQRSGSRKNVAKARRLKGQAYLALGRPEEAEQEILAALELAQEVGSPPQIWKTQVALGNLRRAQARPVDAQQAYYDAVAVIDGVATSLTDESLRATFVTSDHIQAIRDAAETPPSG